MKKNTVSESESLTTVVVKLIESAVEKRNELIAIANKRANQITQTAEQECKRIETQLNDRVSDNEGKETRILRDKINGKAELEGRKIFMHTRAEVITAIFKNVENKLQAIAEQRDENFNFQEILSKLLIEAIVAIGGKNFIVSANKRDRDYLEKNQSEIVSTIQTFLGDVNMQILDKPIDTIGGVIVRNTDNTKIYYNTLESRLQTVRNRSEAELARILGAI